MSEYINVQKAIDKINERARETFTFGLGYEYYLGALHDVADDLRQMPTVDAVPSWISVTERLPEHEYGESTSVLTVDLYGGMRVTYFDGGNWCWPSGEALTTMRVAPITHWMPLPEPPKEERR